MPTYFDIEVALSGVYPMIWRRFLLRTTSTTFADLHRAIQDAAGQRRPAQFWADRPRDART